MSRSLSAAVGALAVVAVLPAQDAAAKRAEFPYSMDFGPCLTTTLQSRGTPGVTHKALVIRFDGGAAAFDTELLRMSSIWADGWLELRGTAYDGAHGPMPRLEGRQLASVASGPGFAKGDVLADPRRTPYGPLPKDWGSYEGYWLCGSNVVLGYRCGDMVVKEMPGIERDGNQTIAIRQFEFGPSQSMQTFVVLDAPAGATARELKWTGSGKTATGLESARAAMVWQVPQNGVVEYDVASRDWSELGVGAPTDRDWLDVKSGKGAVIEFVPGFRRPHGMPAPAAGVAESPEALRVPVLADGMGAARDDDGAAVLRFDSGEGDARLHVDLQQAVEVSRVSVFSRAAGGAAIQRYDVFASEAAAVPSLTSDDPAANGWRRIAKVDGRELRPGGMHVASIAQKAGLGLCRHLLFVLRGAETQLTEIDVFAGELRANVDTGTRPPVFAAATAIGSGVALTVENGRMLLRVVPHKETIGCRLKLVTGGKAGLVALDRSASREALNLGQLVAAGNDKRWGSTIVTKGTRGSDDGPFAVDTITIPFDNPFGSSMRIGGLGFFADGRAAVSTWNGDVWIVSGIDDTLAELRWRRFATGLYDPLGLAVVDDTVYVHGRDGITRLHDKNGDGEADFYECFNHDVEVTNAFHEFAFDLQTDPEGNFYCSKGAPVNPGGRGFMTIAAHHGTIMKIGKDGSSLEVVASGLRAPNGIGVSPDGKVITSGDNEGTFMPRCRLNWIAAPGFYGGVRDTAHRDVVPAEPDRPLCYMPMEVDNSSGGQVWVTGQKWSALAGRLLHLSYGTCSVYLVLEDFSDSTVQGGVVRLPCEFSSSAMRARFSPRDGELYVAGLQGWQTSAVKLGGFHRVRCTQKPLHLPVAMRTCDRGVYLTFADPVDPKTAADPGNFGFEIWNYRYSPNYGSPEVSVLHPERQAEEGKPNRDALPITAVKLGPDGRTVFLAIDGMKPAMQTKVSYNVDAADGAEMRGEVHGTIHVLVPDPGFAAAR